MAPDIAHPRHRSPSLILCLGLLTSIVLAYYANTIPSIDTMGGLSRLLNKITKSEGVPAQAQMLQQSTPPAAYHAQQPQMAQQSSGKRMVGYFVSLVDLGCLIN